MYMEHSAFYHNKELEYALYLVVEVTLSHHSISDSAPDELYTSTTAR